MSTLFYIFFNLFYPFFSLFYDTLAPVVEYKLKIKIFFADSMQKSSC